MKYLKIKEFCSIILVILYVISNPLTFGKAEYDKLPKLDGKIDSKTNNAKTISTTDTINITNKENLSTQPNNTNFLSTNRFNEYQNDLNNITKELINLQTTINNGTNIQIFSAKATTASFLNNMFKNKWGGKNESNFESYKLIQKVIDSSLYTKDYWINSNKISINMNGLPDKIIQTKLLEINTDIDKLKNIIKIQESLTKE